ncbi:MAG: DUF4339 domain-containing protein [Planctomycetaceae bacterium]
MSQQWYYRKLDQEHGPIPEEVLRGMIRSGALHQDDMVCRNRGDWMSVAESPFIDDSSPAAAPESKQSGVANSSKEVRSAIAESQQYLNQRDVRLAKQSETRHRRQLSLPMPELGWIVRFPIAVVNALIALTGHLLNWVMDAAGPVLKSKLTWGGLVILVVNYLAYVLPASTLTQAEVQTFLKQSVTELRRLRSTKAEEEQWDKFSQRTRDMLRDIIPQLEQSANTDDPVSIETLYLARDFLPKMLIDARQQPSEAERKFDVHMDRVERVYARESSWLDQIHNWPLLVIAVIDGVLVIVGFMWWKSA